MYLMMVIATMQKGKPMDDLISRKAAITQLSHNKNNGDDEWELAVQNDIQTIWKLPSAQPEQQWIPCSETIDIPDYKVLACDKYGGMMIGYLVYNKQWICESETELMYDSIAYMPLPKPYKEDDHD